MFSSKAGNNLQCSLCPWNCLLAPAGAGRCGVRFNQAGELHLPYYGAVTALAMDPIEKKPLYHFRPGTEILSVGFAGCNLHCPFCQNWRISQGFNSPGLEGRVYSPAELISAAVKSAPAECKQIAYTYSEPLVHIEFLLDSMKEARGAGISNILVSNGCINQEAAGEILAYTDAANIDLKCFSAETYRDILGGDLSTVTAFIRLAAEKGVHLELTTLVVPGLNDSKEELDKCRDFITELESAGSGASSSGPVPGGFIPWHLSAYRPEYKWKAPATDPKALIAAAERAREKLKYVYTGNINTAGKFNDTLCPSCGKTLVNRRAYRAEMPGLMLKEINGKPVYFCAACGERAPIVF